jgi:hypothetical protein
MGRAHGSVGGGLLLRRRCSPPRARRQMRGSAAASWSPRRDGWTGRGPCENRTRMGEEYRRRSEDVDCLVYFFVCLTAARCTVQNRRCWRRFNSTCRMNLNDFYHRTPVATRCVVKYLISARYKYSYSSCSKSHSSHIRLRHDYE